jgi:hypothetical protein
VEALRQIGLLEHNLAEQMCLEQINLVLEQMEVEQMSLDRIGLLLVEMPEQQVLLLRPQEQVLEVRSVALLALLELALV